MLFNQNLQGFHNRMNYAFVLVLVSFILSVFCASFFFPEKYVIA